MDLVFQEHPLVWLGESWFRNVPTIIQWEDVPLMEVGQFEPGGYSTKFAIYHSDGTKIAVVKGSQFYLTAEGQSAQLTLRHPPGMTVCELEGRTIFELRREEAAALKTTAELYAPEGVFIKTSDACLDIAGRIASGNYTTPNGFTLKKCFAWNMPIGIHITKNIVGIGTRGGPYPNLIGEVYGADEGATWFGQRLDDEGKLIDPVDKYEVHVGEGPINLPPDAPPGMSIPSRPQAVIITEFRAGDQIGQTQ